MIATCWTWRRLAIDMVRGLALLGVMVLSGCTTISLDRQAFQESGVRIIGIVIGSAPRAVLSRQGPWIIEEVYAALPTELRQVLDESVFRGLHDALVGKGYRVTHLKTVDTKWDLYSNLAATPDSYNNLLRKYAISPLETGVDAVLFVEYMLQPKGVLLSKEQVNRMTLGSFEVTYAKAKLWLYDLQTGKRLFFAINQKGYEQVFSHVTPDAALEVVLRVVDIPHAP